MVENFYFFSIERQARLSNKVLKILEVIEEVIYCLEEFKVDACRLEMA
jgi:hypothetical protein